MSIGANVSVITAGAVLAFATHIHSTGISIQAIGGVLMAVGAVSLVLQISSLAKQRRLTAVQAGTMPASAIAVRPPGAAGPAYAPNPYAGTTADPLPAYDAVYQSADDYTGNEW
jgi:hypothetical protein